VVFVFEPSRYEVARHEDGRLLRLNQVGDLTSVAVVGSFNQWKRNDGDWAMKRTGPDRFELRKPLVHFSKRAEWPYKFLVNGDLWVGAPASAANREVVVTDTATFNLLLRNPGADSSGDAAIIHAYRERLNAAWPGQGANLAMDERMRYQFTFTHLPPGVRVTDLENRFAIQRADGIGLAGPIALRRPHHAPNHERKDNDHQEYPPQQAGLDQPVEL